MTTTEAEAYNHIRRGNARSRAELARVMNVSRPTASAVAYTLLAAGLLREAGKYCGTGGRRPTLLIPCSEAFSLIGADIVHPDRMTGVRVNALGEVMASTCAPPLPDDPVAAAENIVRLWEQLDPDFSALGIGVAMPEESASEPGQVEILVKALRRHLIGKYIHVVKRLLAEALSEGFCGGADPCRDYLLLSWENSVKAVICIGGRPFFGAHALAGDLRCLPSVSDNGAVADFGDALSRCVQGTSEGSGSLAAVCASALRYVLAVLDPEAVVLSGRFAACDADFFRLLSRRLHDFCCRIAPSRFGEFSAARGAALLTHFSI